MARPPKTSPMIFYQGVPGGQFNPPEPSPGPAVSSDLHDTWRRLQISVTQAMPYHLNRAVLVMNHFRAAVR